MPPGGFESAIPGNERPQNHALDSAATGIGFYSITFPIYYFFINISLLTILCSVNTQYILAEEFTSYNRQEAKVDTYLS